MNVDITTAVLGNPLILKTILCHLSNVVDLKQFRLVSRLWWKESLEKWRSTATLQLRWESNRLLTCICMRTDTNQFDPSRQGQRALGQADFLQLWEKSVELGVDCPYQLLRRPFTQYRIINCDTLDVAMNIRSSEFKKLENFLDIIGSHVKYLHLDHCKFQPANHEEMLRWILWEKAAALEELTLCVQPLDDEDWRRLRWSKVQPISKLRKLSMRLCPAWRPVGIREEALSGIIPPGINFPQLTQLYLYSERVIPFKALRRIKGLKVLWIDRYRCTNDWNQRIAREAEEPAGGDADVIWGDLEHLHLDYFRFNLDSLRTLWKWMPNLSGLQLAFSPITRSEAQELWPNLGELIDLNSANAGS